MKKHHRLFLYLLVLVFMVSCHKNKEVDLKPDVNVANDVVIAECAFKYIFNMIVKAQTDQALQANHVDWIDSAWVIYNPNQNEFIFEYSEKMCQDSVRRNGKFEAKFDSGFLRPGSKTMVLFESYYDGNESIHGMDSIVNNGIASGNRMVFTNYVKNGMILKGLANNAVITWSSETQFITNANSFNQPGDITFLMGGTCEGISSKDYSFSATLDSLMYIINCPWILAGKIHLSIPGAEYSTGIVDFIPNDGCSNKMIYTFEGSTFILWKNPQYLKN